METLPELNKEDKVWKNAGEKRKLTIWKKTFKKINFIHGIFHSDTEFINFSAQKNTHKKHDQKSLETLINA